MRDVVPFVLALVLVVSQPALDKPWLATFKARVPENHQNEQGLGPWVADTAAFLPSSLLTLVALFLLLPEETSDAWALLGLLTSVVLCLVIYLLAANRKRPSTKRPRATWYTWLQYFLIAMNIAGLVVAEFVY